MKTNNYSLLSSEKLTTNVKSETAIVPVVNICNDWNTLGSFIIVPIFQTHKKYTAGGRMLIKVAIIDGQSGCSVLTKFCRILLKTG